jgi:hypothetical protein
VPAGQGEKSLEKQAESVPSVYGLARKAFRIVNDEEIPDQGDAGSIALT